MNRTLSRLFRSSLFLATCLAFSTNIFAGFGPWPHPYFLEGGLLSCPEEKECLAPRMDDVTTLKSDWLNYEEERLKRIDRLEVIARSSAEKILEIGQLEFQNNEDSLFGKIYAEYGSRLLTNISENEIESMRLWVSQSSPMYLKILELEAKLIEWQNQIDQQQDPDLKEGLILLRNEKYKEWVDGDLQETLVRMKEIQLQVFPKDETGEASEDIIADGLMNLSLELSQYITFNSCPKKVEEKIGAYIGRVQFSQGHRKEGDLDPIADQKRIRFILVGSGFGKPLQVKCKKAGFLSKIKATYEKRHTIEVKYKTKSDSNGVTKYRLPSKSQITSLLR